MEKNRPTLKNRIPHRYGWLFAVILLVTACSKSYDEPTTWGEEIATNATMADVAARYHGTTTPIDDEMIIAARVTANDEAGNFYRSLMIEAEGTAIELMAGIDHLHNDYPLGAKLYIRLRDLALGERLGVLQLGRMPEAASGYPTDYIGSKAALDRHIIRSKEPLAELLPEVISLTELSPRMAGCLVRIEGVRWVAECNEEGAVINPLWAGYQAFTDSNNRLIHTFVRTYADFAEERIPTETLTLTGILQYDAEGEGSYLLKLRDEKDWTTY